MLVVEEQKSTYHQTQRLGIATIQYIVDYTIYSWKIHSVEIFH